MLDKYLKIIIAFLLIQFPKVLFAIPYVYTPFNYPNSIATAPWDINDAGDIVGEYALERGMGKAFVYINSVFISIEIPGAIYSSARGINNLGDIVGTYIDNKGQTHGFIYKNGNLTTYDVRIAEATRTILTGINDAGYILGMYDDGSGNLYGFLDANGNLSIINFGTDSTFTSGINNNNQIVGVYRPGTITNRGYLYENGIFSTVPPIETQSQAFDINDAGYIVGDCYLSGRRLGFLYDGIDITLFNYSGSTGTYLLGINNKGVIVGAYTDNSLGFSRSLGFVATPVPEISTLLLFLSGLIIYFIFLKFLKSNFLTPTYRTSTPNAAKYSATPF